jgi:uncharacterized protein (DUF736 family)
LASIGIFTPTKEGGWTGTVRTLSIDAKVKFVPNDNRSNERAPTFRIYVGRSDVGAAWIGAARATASAEYFDVKLDDPTWQEPFWAILRIEKTGSEAHLIWRRQRLLRCPDASGSFSRAHEQICDVLSDDLKC